MMTNILPRLPRHRPSAAVKLAYQDQVAAFCRVILEHRSRLDFDVGSGRHDRILGLRHYRHQYSRGALALLHEARPDVME
jgi:hypothetical protein